MTEESQTWQLSYRLPPDFVVIDLDTPPVADERDPLAGWAIDQLAELRDNGAIQLAIRRLGPPFGPPSTISMAISLIDNSVDPDLDFGAGEPIYVPDRQAGRLFSQVDSHETPDGEIVATKTYTAIIGSRDSSIRAGVGATITEPEYSDLAEGLVRVVARTVRLTADNATAA